MITALNISNNILKKSFDENIPITPMKLQKLIYILYKTYLKETNKSLFRESFQAWKNGPVLKTVYDEFKLYGANNIECYYSCSSVENCKIFTMVEEDKSEPFKNILNSVWNKYKNYSPKELSKLTNLKNGAWEKAKSKDGLLNDIDIIQEKDYI